jgi:SAM-dependent methyltransferase
MNMNQPTNNLALAPNRPAAADAPFWIEAAGQGTCPVCASPGPHELLSDRVLSDARIALSGASRQALSYLRCGSCGTVYAPDGASLRYEDEAGSEDALRYYLEEGAGIDLMVEPLGRLDHSRIHRYVEVGCSFGFSLDYARRSFGWDVRGIDPSPLAAAGRDALGLPIEQRYFGPDTPLAGPPAHLLQAAEVIEHVTDPHGFMRALLASLDENGVLVISTPNAAVLRDGVPDAMLLQVLQPGMHLTLFSADSLVALAKAHGLWNHRIHETPEDVTLTASRYPFAFHQAAACDRTLYLDYLRWRLPLACQDTPLRRGLMSRLLRELTLQGRFDEMDPVLPEIFAEYGLRGIDLADPGSLAHPQDAPFNVAAILFCLGMREVSRGHDRRRGIAYFDAAVAWRAGARAPLSVGGVEDASAAAVAEVAASQAASARIALDPEGEHDRRMAGANRDALSPPHRQMLFAELVNRGDMARAAVHYGPVAEAAAEWDETVGGPDPIGHHAMTCFALGIFALNHVGDRPVAGRWLGRSADLASRDPANEDVWHAAMIALHRAADPVDLPTGPAQPPGASGTPAVPRKPAGMVGRLMSRIAATLGLFRRGEF